MLHLIFSAHGAHDCEAMVPADDLRVAILPAAAEDPTMPRSSLCHGGDVTPERLAELILEHEGRLVCWH